MEGNSIEPAEDILLYKSRSSRREKPLVT